MILSAHDAEVPDYERATEIRIGDAARVLGILRFASLEELRKHFLSLGASPGALQVASNSINAIGTAMLVVY